MARWNVGIVGLSRGRAFVNVFGPHPGACVAALCDINERVLAETGKAFNLPDAVLFTDFGKFLSAPIDIVVVATPIRFHAEQAVKSLHSGKHVLCEQTAADSLEGCEGIVQAVKETGKAYMMAENYCYFHYIREWQKIVDAGKLGSIFYAEGEYIHNITHLLVDSQTGQYHWRHERPPIWYCAHTLGPLLTLMRDRIVQACGLTSGFSKFSAYKDHPGFLDIEVGLFRTEKGAVVKILRSQVASRPHTVWYSLYGTKGHLENERDRGDGLYHVEGETAPKGEALACPTVDPDAPDEAKRGGHGTSEYYMIRDFLEAVETNRRPPIDVIRAMDFTVPGLVAHESAMAGGQWMEVPLFNW